MKMAHTADRSRAAPRSHQRLRTPPARAFPVQRKPAGCSCGGACPSCKEDAAAEREADRAAETVLEPASDAPPLIERTARTPASSAAPSDLGPGQPLPTGARQFFEPRFGADFSDVRVHDGSRAHRSAAVISARAYTAGSDVVFAQGAYAPGTSAGDRLMAHELTHVVQQRRGGKSLQRAPEDFEITGTQSKIDDSEMNFYFEKDSAVLDSAEKKKIPKMVSENGENLILKGLRSRDESSDLAQDRADAADQAVKAEVPSATPLVLVDQDALQNYPLYRRLRAVIARENIARNAADICPKDGEEVKETCPEGEVKVKALFRDAENDVKLAWNFVEQSQIDPTGISDVAPKLEKYFGKGYDSDRIVSDLKLLEAHIGVLAARDMGRTDQRPGYRCATFCLRDCVGPVAYSQGLGSDNRMTLCPQTWEKPKSREEAVSTIVHEATHGTEGIGTDAEGTSDDVYAWEKVLRFLSAEELLNSADVIAYFVEDVVHGGADKISPKATDDLSQIQDKDQARKIEEGIARMAKWLSTSSGEMIDVHSAAVKAKKSGWGRGLERDIMKTLAKHFSLPKPARRPREKHIRKIAGIADRIYLMATVAGKREIKVEPDLWVALDGKDPSRPVEWTSKDSPDPARMPGLVVKVDPELFGLLGVDSDEIRAMLESMVKATPSIPSDHVQGYVEVVDMIRNAKDIGP